MPTNKQSTSIDTRAAMEVLGTIYKAALQRIAVCQIPIYIVHAGNEGFWNLFYSSFQPEDIFDCLHVLYFKLNLVLLFDHSHGQIKPSAPSAMSKSYGGAQ